MSKERLHIAYCGDSVDNGSMDVNMLAPALLSIGDLVSEANNVLNTTVPKSAFTLHRTLRKAPLKSVSKLSIRWQNKSAYS